MITYLSEIKVKTEPSIEPVTRTEAKAYAKVDYTDDDSLIDVLITSARKQAEKYCNRAFITQVLQAYWSQFGAKVYIPRSPIQSVDEVKRIKLNESDILTVDSDFYVQGIDEKFILFATAWKLSAGHSPSDRFIDYELQVEFTAGYGALTTDVPAGIREAIMKIVATNYENRQNVSEQSFSKIPESAKTLLNSYKIWHI